MADYYYQVGDFGDEIRLELKEEDNRTPVSLTGRTATLQMKKRGRSALVVDRAMDVVDADLGLVRMVWQENDFLAAGIYEANVVVQEASVLRATFPRPGFIEIQVEDR